VRDGTLPHVVKEPDDPVRRQLALNRSVADHWDLFALHRKRVTDLITSIAGGAPGPLSVLGAGNCNDLDLHRLLGTFAEVDLSDLDLDAMRAGVRRQAADDHRIRIHHADLSGVAGWLRRWAASPPPNEDIDRWLFRLEGDAVRRRPGREVAGVAASTGLLSQMTGMATRVLGLNHPRTVEVALAIRDAHLRDMVGLLAASGAGLVITDITSSVTLDRLDRLQIAGLTERLVRCGDVTTGTNPLGIEASLRAQEDAVTDVTRHDPWVWRVTDTKSQLMVAISFRRV